MSVTTTKYIRKPLYVAAVRVTSTNFDEIVAWCQGEVQQEEVPGKGTGKKFIKVRVHNPKNPRQTKAYVGDWLLYTERGYKVYTNKAFHSSFDEVLMEEPEDTSSAETLEEARSEGLVSSPSEIERIQHEVGPDIELVPATPESIAQAVRSNEEAREEVEVFTDSETPVATVDTAPEQEKIAAEGKRVLSIAEQDQMGSEEIRELIQAGEAVLAQDIAAA